MLRAVKEKQYASRDSNPDQSLFAQSISKAWQGPILTIRLLACKLLMKFQGRQFLFIVCGQGLLKDA